MARILTNRRMISWLVIFSITLSFHLEALANVKEPDKRETAAYVAFADNLLQGRFVFNPEEQEERMEAASPFSILIPVLIVGIVVFRGGSPVTTPFRPPTGGTSISAIDPQIASLLSKIVVNGADKTESIIEYALKKENVVYEKYIPNLLGGTLLTGTRAFAGKAMNGEGKEIQDSTVNFGVYQTAAGKRFIGPILTFKDVETAEQLKTIQLDFNPVIKEHSGDILQTTGNNLIALDEGSDLNKLVEVSDRRDDSGQVAPINCPKGFEHQTTIIKSISNTSNTALTGLELFIRDIVPQDGLVLDSDRELGGTGTMVGVPYVGNYADGILSPGEKVQVPISVCMQKEQKDLSITADVTGIEISHMAAE